MSKVFVINDCGHDYSEAKRFGELVYLTKGQVPSFNTNKNYRTLLNKMKSASDGDYILVTSLASLNCIAGWIIGHLGLSLNLLLFKDGRYLKRRLVPKLIGEQHDKL